MEAVLLPTGRLWGAGGVRMQNPAGFSVAIRREGAVYGATGRPTFDP